jgi:uncharacterized protein (DUF305 family)
VAVVGAALACRNLPGLAVAVSVVAVDAVTGHLLTPAEDSAEAGFARDMAVHHAQAVEMAELVRDRAERDGVRTLAVDIALTQQAQIGRLHGWLDAWGLPITGTGRPMAWTGRAGDGGMPGLATRAQLNRLDDLDGQAAEVLFLQLMIPHHEAGVDMAKAVQERTRRREVRRLAEAMVASQETEIEAMRRLLAEVRGESPPPSDARVHVGQGRVHR